MSFIKAKNFFFLFFFLVHLVKHLEFGMLKFYVYGGGAHVTQYESLLYMNPRDKIDRGSGDIRL